MHNPVAFLSVLFSGFAIGMSACAVLISSTLSRRARRATHNVRGKRQDQRLSQTPKPHEATDGQLPPAPTPPTA